jgi:tetratricopeptide (TPR) repeat protein
MARAVTLFANSLGLLIPLENATDVLAGALSIARDARDADLQCRIHNLFGITYGDLRDFDEAELHFSCASQLDEHHPGLHQRWRIRANLANLQRKQADAAREAGDIEACQLYCERGRRLLYELFRKLERDENISMHLDVLFIAGLIEIAAGRSGAARIYFEEAWALAHAGKHRTVLPSLGVHLGYLNLSDGRMAVADQILTEALHEAMFYRPSPKAARLCELSAEWHRLQGDARGEAYFRSQALEARRDFDALKSAAGLQLAEVARMLKG